MLTPARRRLGATTLGLLLLIGLLVVVAATASRSGRVDPRGLAEDSHLLGRTVVLVGRVASSAPGILVLSPEDAETPTVRVHFVDAAVASGFGRGSTVVLEGKAVGPGEVEDARLRSPVGPSRYMRKKR